MCEQLWGLTPEQLQDEKHCLIFGFSIIGGVLLPESPCFNTYKAGEMEQDEYAEGLYDESTRLSSVEI